MRSTMIGIESLNFFILRTHALIGAEFYLPMSSTHDLFSVVVQVQRAVVTRSAVSRKQHRASKPKPTALAEDRGANIDIGSSTVQICTFFRSTISPFM
jgi:hypothetical protein